MRLAVLTTTYNMAHTLGSAMWSVMQQTRKPDLHVIVDDASTDDGVTPGMVERYREQASYPVRLVTVARNGGHAGALNMGIAATRADADWYVKLDADDRLYENALERIERHAVGDVNVIYTPFQLFGDFTHVFRFPPFDPLTMTEECQIPGPSAFDARLWDAVGGFDATMRYGEDWDFWIRAQLAVGLAPKCLLSPLWYYRVYANWQDRHADQPFQELFKPYWREHTRETVLARSRTWAAFTSKVAA